MNLMRKFWGQCNRALSAVSLRLHVAMANTWRDSYNPLRGLDIRRAVSLLEAGERGEMAELQWTYRFIEMQDATLGALIERRIAAIKKLSWDVKVRDDVPEAVKAEAEAQRAAVRNLYEGIDNLRQAWETMCMATFRGYACLEKLADQNGQLRELAEIPTWHLARKGLTGEWCYNAAATFGASSGEPIQMERVVMREVARPVNRVGLVAYVRKGLSQKDWDGFIETYGIPAVFVIMPPNVPLEKESEYFATAQDVVSDSRGTLPHGSDIKTVDNGARGNNPFKEHIIYQDEQVVLRGTGGKLTMLTSSTGMNDSQGDAHADAFEDLAKAEAADISEIFDREITRPYLEKMFPEQRRWVYFQIAANEETDTSAIVADAVSLASAGYKLSAEFLSEKTGYEVQAEAATAEPAMPIQNRATPDAPRPTLFDALRGIAEESIIAGWQDADADNANETES